MDAVISINHMPLPAALVTAMKRGEWKTPERVQVWQALFPHEQISQPMLYSLEGIRATNSGWWIKESRQEYLGRAGEGFDPGDIDPSHSLLIADLGPDRLIALDYRASENHPSVVALISDESYWLNVAYDVESFMKLLHLTGNN